MAQATFSVRMDEALNAETIAALKEAEEMLCNPDKYKRYGTFQEAIREILKDK